MDSYIAIIEELQLRLHECPELAFEEEKTKEVIRTFLFTQTELEIQEAGQWLFAKYVPGKNSKASRRIAFRADFDAVTGGNGKPGHYCGHDGHTAILLGLAKYVNDVKPKDTLYFIFQPAEETGQGADLCSRILKEENIERIYGFHNIPGQPLGSVLLLDGTFACASTGLEIRFEGKPSHAAYPEAGANPATAVANTILEMNRMLEKPHEGILLGTVIGVDLGSSAYGLSASDAVLRLTLRGEKQREFEDFLAHMKQYVIQMGREHNLVTSMKEIERFPATENHKEALAEVAEAAKMAGFATIVPREPFRWSEDFGYYLQKTSGAFFGVGDGENHPQLHTEGYAFPQAIIPYVFTIFTNLIRWGE